MLSNKINILIFWMNIMVSQWLIASHKWYFLPNFGNDIRGVEKILPGSFPEELPETIEKLLSDENILGENERSLLKWHTAEFPHKDFVDMMPSRNVFGWYACEFNIPNNLKNFDILLDLGIIDDADECFLNGTMIGEKGRIPGDSAWQTDRLYRIPGKIVLPEKNVLTAHVWSLWGLGGIAGPPVMKAALLPENGTWQLAYIRKLAVETEDLNKVQSAKKALSICFDNNTPVWRSASLPWKDYRNLPDDIPYLVFKTNFKLPSDESNKCLFTDDVVIDMGAVFDVAAFFLNGKRLGSVGRFATQNTPAFTEAASRGRFIVSPEDWSDKNELIAVVYHERGVAGLPGIPGILLKSPDTYSRKFRDVLEAVDILQQSGQINFAERLLSHAKPRNDLETAWILSWKSHLAFLKWFDKREANVSQLRHVLKPMRELICNYPVEAPKQAAMQAFCRVLRMAEQDKNIEKLVKKYFPNFNKNVKFMKHDWNTRGNWPLFYGNQEIILCGYGKISDYHWSKDDNLTYSFYTGDANDHARCWQPNAQKEIEDNNGLIFPYHLAMKEWNDNFWLRNFWDYGKLVSGKKIRRWAWRDDHGEMHPFDDAGSDLCLNATIAKSDTTFVALYLCDVDWWGSHHPRQQSVMVFDKAGFFHNACWIGKMNRGVYTRFAISDLSDIKVRVNKHRGACVALSGVFQDILCTRDEESQTEVLSQNTKNALDIVYAAGIDYSGPFRIQDFKSELLKIKNFKDCAALLHIIMKIKNAHPAWQLLCICRLEELTEGKITLEQRKIFEKLLKHTEQEHVLIPIHNIIRNILNQYKNAS